MKRILLTMSAVLVMTASGIANASIIQAWHFTYKSQGIYGAHYGLHFKQVHLPGLAPGSSTRFIFGFERAGHGLQMRLAGIGGTPALQGGKVLSLYYRLGLFNHKMDATYSRSPDGNGWMAYGRHNGDYGLNKNVAVPEPSTLFLLGAGLLCLGLLRPLRFAAIRKS